MITQKPGFKEELESAIHPTDADVMTTVWRLGEVGDAKSKTQLAWLKKELPDYSHMPAGLDAEIDKTIAIIDERLASASE